MRSQKRKLTRKEQVGIAREDRDYSKYCKLTDLNEDLTPQDHEWMLTKNVRYTALTLVLEDYYENFTKHGLQQSNHSIDWWERWLRTLTVEEQDAELTRLWVKVTTEIAPWLDQQREES